jgi:RNA polymerase sigma-70 factor (ECF subfamily)
MVDPGTKGSFLESLEQNQDILHKICGIYSANEPDREDLGQEIVCQLWKSYRSFRGDSKFTTWMYRIALNTALLYRRRYRYWRRVQSMDTHPAHVSDATGASDRPERIGALYAAIRRLREFDRALILLHLEQLSYKEMAQIMGISEANVSVRLVRIKNELKELLSQES